VTEIAGMPPAPWTIRRRIVALSLLFCAGVIVHSMIWQDSESIAEVVITNAFWSAGAIIGSYVFGAVWDDQNHRRALGRDHR
jgi:hypothetical protein